MAWILSGTNIRKPNSASEENNTQVAENRTLSGNINRDYFGSNKNKMTLHFENVNYTDWLVINTIYLSYLSLGTTKTFQITDTNYNGTFTTSRNVHVDMLNRDFSIPGSSYLANFVLVLTES